MLKKLISKNPNKARKIAFLGLILNVGALFAFLFLTHFLWGVIAFAAFSLFVYVIKLGTDIQIASISELFGSAQNTQPPFDEVTYNDVEEN